MMASLSTYAQYPTTKVIKGEQVVIMTVKQAEAINNKFQVMEDSIASLNNDLNSLNNDFNGAVTSLNFTQNKVEILTDSINNLQNNLTIVNKQYDEEVKKIDKLEFIDRKTRLQVKLGIVLVGAVWLYGIITNH